MTNRQKHRINQMRRQGFKVQYIAKELGLDHYAVRCFLIGEKPKPKPTVSPRTKAIRELLEQGHSRDLIIANFGRDEYQRAL